MRLEHLLSGDLGKAAKAVKALAKRQEQPWYGPLSILFILIVLRKELQASSYKLQAYDRVSRSEQQEASSLKLEAKLKRACSSGG